MPTATKTAKPAKPKPAAKAKPATSPVRAPVPPGTPPVSEGIPATSGPDTGADVALGAIRVCPFNLRRHFDDADIAGLAESIRADRLQQPLEVRPVGVDAAPVWDEKGRRWEGLDHFQLTDGERRLRALHYICEHYPAEAHACATVQVLIRPLSDEQVRERMLASREQSRPLSVSELVAGYVRVRAGLPDDKALADLVGAKSVGQVRGVLALAKLPAWALAAVDAGALPRATAEVVARVPGERARAMAACCVLLGHLTPDGKTDTCLEDDWWKVDVAKGFAECEPLSYRDAKDLIRNHFTVELKGAPFDRKSLDLLPEAGGCEACPKRAGNDAEATAEGTRADVCLDPDCYRQKVAAHDAATIQKGIAKGAERPPEELVWPSHGDGPPKGWCEIGDVLAEETELAPEFVGNKRRTETLLALLGMYLSKAAFRYPDAGGPTIYATLDAKHKLRCVAKTAEVRKFLVAKGILKKPEPRAKGQKPEPRKAQATKEPEGPYHGDVVRRATATAARTLSEYGEEQFKPLASLDGYGAGDPVCDALRIVAGVMAYDELVDGYRISPAKDVLRERFPGVVAETGSDHEDERLIDAALAKWDAPKLLAFVLQLAACVELQHDGPRRDAATRMLAFAELDWDALEEQARRALTGGEAADEKVAKAEAAEGEKGERPSDGDTSVTEAGDLTSEKERLYDSPDRDSPADRDHREKIADFRARQKAGTAAPVWGKWSEFDLLLADGRKVRVLYDPFWLTGKETDHFEFHGEATSSTGYRSHFEMFGAKRPKITLEAWSLKAAEDLAAAEKVDKEKRERAAKRDANKAAKDATPPATSGKPAGKKAAAK